MDQGWLWIVIDVVAVIVLGAALVYGIMRYRRRRPVETAQTRQAVKDIYREDRPGEV